MRDHGPDQGGRSAAPPRRSRPRVSAAKLSWAGSAWLGLVPPVAAALLAATWRSARRVEIGLREADVRERCAPPYILAFWHSRLLYPAWAFRHHRPAALVSRHRDGELIARCAKRLGVHCVRGASGGFGEEALLEAVRLVRDGASFGITPDGPVGPPLVVKPGVVRLAALSGAPIVPLSWSARPRLRFRSWDRFELPLPFARVAVALGEPILVPATVQREEAERARIQLQESLLRLTAEVEAAVGRPPRGDVVRRGQGTHPEERPKSKLAH